jgi:hypothetical protein
MAPRARFELATLRLTAEEVENLSALSGVAYRKIGAIFPSWAAPDPGPNPMSIEKVRNCHIGGRRPQAAHMIGDGVVKSASSSCAISRTISCSVM